LILNTGFEAVGNYCPIDVENVNINTERKSVNSNDSSNLTAISQWKKLWMILEKQKSKKSNPVYKKRTLLKNSTEPSNVKLTEKRKVYDN
jgi:hypothetical protein